MKPALEGRRILVVGAASGIGLATARRFLDEGAAIAGADRDHAGLATLRRDAGSRSFAEVPMDVTDPGSVAQGVAKARNTLGGLDGLVNAAGIDLLADIGRWRSRTGTASSP